jgi:hypothetical protein
MRKLALATFGLLLGTSAHAQIVRVTEANFIAGSGLITFSEKALGTVNPTYAPGDYGGGAGSPTVTFEGWFTGQSLSLNPAVDCPGAAATACVVGNPIGPLSLDGAAPDTRIVNDGAAPNSPVLSGSPTFNGPVAVLFDVDLAGVGFDAGFFDGVGSTGITAFARDGTLLGTITNLGTGIEFLGLVTADGSERIAGVFLDLVGTEPAGFAIDSLRFGRRGQVNPIPEPATWALMIAGFGLAGAAVRRRARYNPALA